MEFYGISVWKWPPLLMMTFYAQQVFQPTRQKEYYGNLHGPKLLTQNFVLYTIPHTEVIGGRHWKWLNIFEHRKLFSYHRNHLKSSQRLTVCDWLNNSAIGDMGRTKLVLRKIIKNLESSGVRDFKLTIRNLALGNQKLSWKNPESTLLESSSSNVKLLKSFREVGNLLKGIRNPVKLIRNPVKEIWKPVKGVRNQSS